MCDRVVLCLGRHFYFGFLRAMFSRPEFSSQPLPFVSFVARSTRLNLARRMEWIGEMISPHFLDAIDEVRNRLEEERRRKEGAQSRWRVDHRSISFPALAPFPSVSPRHCLLFSSLLLRPWRGGQVNLLSLCLSDWLIRTNGSECSRIMRSHL